MCIGKDGVDPSTVNWLLTYLFSVDMTMVSLTEAAELLFWAPALVDLMLLVTTFSLFCINGVSWFLGTVPEKRRVKYSDLNADAKRALGQVWGVLMVAYSAYGVLLPLCVFWAGFVDPAMRPAFCAAMTVLMACKVGLFYQLEDRTSSVDQGKLKSLFYFYLPCYGGYVLWSIMH